MRPRFFTLIALLALLATFGACRCDTIPELPWSALGELRVPAPPNPGDIWRVNLYSFRDGQKHSLAWSPIMGKGNFHKTSQFGRVTFK